MISRMFLAWRVIGKTFGRWIAPLFVGAYLLTLWCVNTVGLALDGLFFPALGQALNADGGMNMSFLLVMAAILGMGGAFISLAISKWSAKRMTGAHVIEQPTNDTERWLMHTVKLHAQRAGIGMPEVAIFDSPDMNAFATGMNRNNALVAVSTGLKVICNAKRWRRWSVTKLPT